MAWRVIMGLLLIAVCGSQQLPASAKPPPQCETAHGQMVRIIVPSLVYSKPVPATVYLPPCYADTAPTLYPTVYLLHGGGADETQWPDLNVQPSADDLIAHGEPPFIVVMPGAVYSDAIDYGAFVLRDLIPHIQTLYRVQGVRAGRLIGGLSLGGYWALRVAFLHSDWFAAVGGYSPVITLGYDEDPLTLARHANVQTLQNLKIALDVGNKDSLSYDTKILAQTLRGRGVTVSLTIGQGTHIRDYWRAHTHDYFTFFEDIIDPAQNAGSSP